MLPITFFCSLEKHALCPVGHAHTVGVDLKKKRVLWKVTSQGDLTINS